MLAEYDRAREAPVAGEYSKYYTGEAYWALARLHLAFPDQGWGETADRIGAYLAGSRDEREGYWPPIPDHWAAYGQAETVEFPDRGQPPLTSDELDYAREQAGLMGVQARWLAQSHGPWGLVARGPNMARGGWYGVVGEALTGWWLTAQADARMADLREPIAARAACVAGLAMEEQSDASDAADAIRPERVEGAWFRDDTTRMDDQQHALAGLLRTIPIVEAGEAGAGDDFPSGWLWAAALLLGAQSRAGRVRRAARGALAARRCAAGRDRRGDRRTRRLRGGCAGGPAARPLRRERAIVPRRRRPRGRRCSASPTCSGGRPRRSRRSTAGARRWCRWRSRWWPAPRCWCWR